MGAECPFTSAPALLQRVTGVSMSPATMRRLTIATGTTMQQVELDVVAAIPVGGEIPIAAR